MTFICLHTPSSPPPGNVLVGGHLLQERFIRDGVCELTGTRTVVTHIGLLYLQAHNSHMTVTWCHVIALCYCMRGWREEEQSTRVSEHMGNRKEEVDSETD